MVFVNDVYILILFFNLCSEQKLREIKDMKSLVIGDYNINNLPCADNAVPISNSCEEVQAIIDKILKESEKSGLSISY